MNFKRSCNRDPGEVVCEDFSINCATEIREGISEMTRLVADSTPGRDLFFHCKRQIHRLTTTFKLEHNSIAGHTATLPPPPVRNSLESPGLVYIIGLRLDSRYSFRGEL